MPLAIELTSECLKSCTPNMKKKKDPSFDELKASVIKPIKECVNMIKNHFSVCSNAWNETTQDDLLSLEDGSDEKKLIESLDADGHVMSYLVDKRLAQINKENKATNERFKDLN